MKKIALIYMGGTFGCIGEPLSPMPAAAFMPKLQQALPPHLNIECFSAPSIRDSSACTASDWMQLLRQIQQLQLKQYFHFVIVHGTDTLSYAAAVLSRFMGQSAHVVLTGSQYPLLNVQGTDTREFSDASGNLNFALEAVLKSDAGVYLAFHHQLLHAASAQKIHTTDLDAFTGTPASSPWPAKINPLIVDEQQLVKAASFNCLSLMMQPAAPELHLASLQTIASQPPAALILQAFGTGNLATTPALTALLRSLPERNCAVILTTQVPFGGLDQRYAVSQWLKDANILLSRGSSHADLYAKSLKMYLEYDAANQWHSHWHDEEPN